MPQACAKYCWLPSTYTCYTLGESPQEGASENLNLQIRSMAEISMLVTSIDPLAAYKVCDDLTVELVGVTATVEDDSEGASVGAWWIQIIEPHKLVKHQPHGELCDARPRFKFGKVSRVFGPLRSGAG
jgi:hypothetical protein